MRTPRPSRCARRCPIALLLLLALPLADAPAARAADWMRKQPYLIYPGQPGQIKVLWQLTGTDTCRLAWGTDTTCSLGSVASPEYGDDHQHAVTIEGLEPGTKYDYRETNEGYSYAGSFTSAPAPDAARLKFFAYGDTRSTPSEHDLVARGMVTRFQADPAFQTLTLQMGDYVTQGDNELYWTSDLFHPAYAYMHLLLGNLAYMGVMGNHEGSGVLYKKYLPYPFVAGRYWSFDYGPAHFAMVDQYTAWGAGSAQLDWLHNDLASSDKPWKFVVLHEPGWSSGAAHPNNVTVQTQIEPLCEQYGVAILFAGHNHNYCRAVVDGVQHITTGGGGAPPESPLPGQPNVVIAAGGGHFCTITIDCGVLHFESIRSNGGSLIDSFTITRPFTDASAPSVRVTAPAAGAAWKAGSRHDITWSAADNVGVTSVDIDGSSDGGATWSPLLANAADAGTFAWA
ncbi:MAG TPA: metallophosphoesterase, partial [Terriglobales bacterium]|nr:metallophosphoesterase [Terriglobales bacterium]